MTCRICSESLVRREPISPVRAESKNAYTSRYEFLRDLALSLNVPATAIVLETTGVNTYEDVVRVRDVLRARGWRRILLVSSPYHMRRAVLVWHRQAPDVDVVPAAPARTQFYAHERGASLDQLRGIAHEYLAIAWYWWKDWI